MKLYYLTHPVRGDEHFSEEENLAHALKVQKILFEAGLNVVNPWFTYPTLYPDVIDDADLTRFIALDREAARRIGHIVQTGHRVSSGMRMEADAVREIGGEILDFVGVPDRALADAVRKTLSNKQSAVTPA